MADGDAEEKCEAQQSPLSGAEKSQTHSPRQPVYPSSPVCPCLSQRGEALFSLAGWVQSNPETRSLCSPMAEHITSQIPLHPQASAPQSLRLCPQLLDQ